MKGEILSIDTAKRMANLEKENKKLSEELQKEKEKNKEAIKMINKMIENELNDIEYKGKHYLICGSDFNEGAFIILDILEGRTKNDNTNN